MIRTLETNHLELIQDQTKYKYEYVIYYEERYSYTKLYSFGEATQRTHKIIKANSIEEALMKLDNILMKQEVGTIEYYVISFYRR